MVVFAKQVSRICPDFSAFTPTVDQLKYTIDTIRTEEREPKTASELAITGTSFFTYSIERLIGYL